MYIMVKRLRSSVQSIIFDRNKFNITKAKKWLKDNDYRSTKVDKTKKFLRFRQRSPVGFKKFRTLNIGKGIKLILSLK